MHGVTFYKLPSGRVMLLDEPLTKEELAQCETKEGTAYLEGLADEMEKRCTPIGPDDPRYHQVLRNHNLS